MDQRIVVVFLIILLPPAQALAVTAEARSPEAQGGPAPAESHGPIIITSETPLWLPDSVAGHGIRSGSGTHGDPYVIGPWTLETGSSITIRDREEHFLITGVTASDFLGMTVENAFVPTLTELSLDGGRIFFSDSPSVRITASQLVVERMRFTGVESVELETTSVRFETPKAEVSLFLDGTSILTMEDVRITNMGGSVGSSLGGDVRSLAIRGSHIESVRDLSLVALDVDQALFEATTLVLPPTENRSAPRVMLGEGRFVFDGVTTRHGGFNVVHADVDLIIINSTIEGDYRTPAAIYVWGTIYEGVSIDLESSTITGHKIGVSLGGGDLNDTVAPVPLKNVSVDLRQNVFSDNRIHVANFWSSTTIDATYSDWGTGDHSEIRDRLHGNVDFVPYVHEGETKGAPGPEGLWLIVLAIALGLVRQARRLA